MSLVITNWLSLEPLKNIIMWLYIMACYVGSGPTIHVKGKSRVIIFQEWMFYPDGA